MITVTCPSYHRPRQLAELAGTWRATTDPADARLVVVLDDDDPTRSLYPVFRQGDGIRYYHLAESPHQLGPILNKVIPELAREDVAGVGFCGDDHRFRTPGWARKFSAVLAGGATVVYGDDMWQGPALPTACVIATPVIRTLGYVAPPGVVHMYLDDFWRRLGEETGGLWFVPDVAIEHMHPHAGKAEMDDGYRKVNNPAQFEADREAYDRFLSGQWHHDINPLRAAVNR